jgi:hypothetical protein
LIDALIADAESGQGTSESPAFASASLDQSGADAAVAAIADAGDASRYLVLMLLLRERPERAETIAPERRATILAAALATLTFLNDFGLLGSDAWDGPAAHALLAAGDAAHAPLVALLDDDRPAPLWGSEAATISKLEHYRRCDFAYRYLSVLRDEQVGWSPDPGERDAAIDALRARAAPHPADD